MILKKGLALWLVAFLIGAFCGCGEDSEGSPVSSASSPQEVMRVAVTIAPLSGLVTPLLPEGSRVDILIPPGLSPHGAELTPSAIAIAAKADLVLGIGFGLDAGALRGVPRERMMLFQDIVELAPSGTHDHADHEGGDHADHADHGHHDGHAGHAHADGDPHVWLNPALCALFVTHVADELIRRGLDDEATRTDRDRLLTALAEIDALYESGLEPHRGVGFVTHHDAWRRLTGRFGVRVVGVIRPIETSEPTPGAIAAAVDAVRSAEASLIIVEPQFDPGAARRVAELTGAPVATLDPLGDGDWFAMMRANLEALTDALGNPSDLGASGGD